MKVLIVSKTRMRNALCVGGLTKEPSHNIRLLQSDGSNQPTDTAFQIGDIWELEFSPRNEAVPPHIEDVLVTKAEKIGQVGSLKDTLLANVPIWRGEKHNLFDSAIRFTPNGSGYVSNEVSIPQGSVGFYMKREPFFLSQDYNKNRYVSKDNQVKFTYVGTQEPIQVIPANTLLRVSLARWWRPDDSNEDKRCYLQLSGWYL